MLTMALLGAGRIGSAAQIGVSAQAAMQVAVEYAKSRRSFDKAIIEHQAVGFRLADLATRPEAARQMGLAAGALEGAGGPRPPTTRRPEPIAPGLGRWRTGQTADWADGGLGRRRTRGCLGPVRSPAAASGRCRDAGTAQRWGGFLLM
mgnify:CR=1 FL=1